MKRFGVVLVIALVLLPMSVMAGMRVASEADLQEVSGQTGVTISMNMSVTATGVAWGDSDGFLSATSAGWVILQNVSMPTVALSNVTIDAGYNGTTAYIAIGTGTSNLISGNLTIGSLIIGSTATATLRNAGEIRVNGIGIGFGTIRISGH